MVKQVIGPLKRRTYNMGFPYLCLEDYRLEEARQDLLLILDIVCLALCSKHRFLWQRLQLLLRELNHKIPSNLPKFIKPLVNPDFLVSVDNFQDVD